MKHLFAIFCLIICLTGCKSSPALQNEPDTQHCEWPDHSDWPWAFESYIGRTLQASDLIIEDEYKIRRLILNLPTNDSLYNAEGYTYTAMFQDCSWGIFYQYTELRDSYKVEIFESHGVPAWDDNLDGSFICEVWYTDTDDAKINTISFIKIYHPNHKETTWTVLLDNIKGTENLVIKSH